MTRSATVKDVGAAAFITGLADHLKNKQEFEVPVYADIIKTGIHKNNSPYDDDWFYVRAAAVARQVYIHRGIGVGALRRHFGGAQRRGTRRQKFVKGSGGLIRNILQQLENLGYVEQDDQGGRIVTDEGQGALDQVAHAVVNQDDDTDSEEED